MNYRSSFLRQAHERGFIHDCTDGKALDELLLSPPPLRAYIGFDLTAPSLHVGSLLPIMLLRLFQQCGHQPIILLGCGTTKIGDPSGKDESRPMQDKKDIKHNAASIRKIFASFLQLEGANKAIFVDNDKWLSKLNYIDFLRNTGRHFSINKMLQAESVRLRLEREQHLSFLEFNYMLLQAYDFYQLYEQEHCLLQMGGSDQWGNITAGIDLTRRLTGKNVFGLTAPLMLTHGGKKMGKTARGAVWLTKEQLSIWDYWQYWRNTDDHDVKRFFKLFTTLSVGEIDELTSEDGAALNHAKKRLAFEATQLCHGTKEAQQCEQTAERLFEGKNSEHASAINAYQLSADSSDEECLLIHILAQSAMTKSRSEARRLIQGGGIKIDDVTIQDEMHRISLENKDPQRITIGKKKFLTVIVR